jgi:hypothetical protein
MKRIYVKPILKIVSCRPLCFCAASSNPNNWQVGAEGDGDAPTGGVDDETEPIPPGARRYIWDE